MWNNILEWPHDEHSIFLSDMRSVLRNRKVHSYMKLRYVYGRKLAGT